MSEPEKLKSAQEHYERATSFDRAGRERAAVPEYQAAIALGLPDEELRGAYLGLASTYRALGEYEKAEQLFMTAMARFPEDRAIKIFYAMVLFNLDKHEQAMEIVVKQLAETSSDPEIQRYSRALLFYSDKLNQTFEEED